MERVLPEPVSPPVELLLLFLRCPRRGERGRRGERPGLPDTDPLPLEPTTSNFETERELPYMVRQRGLYTACEVDQKCEMAQTVQKVSWCPEKNQENRVGGLCTYNMLKKCKIDVQKNYLKH